MTTMKFKLAHQVPGRVRMKIPGARGNPEMLRQIAETFAVIPGIEEIKVNAVTGCVVMHYDTDQHDEFHDHFHRHHGHQTMGYHAPSTEIDELASKIEKEAEFLARNSESARVVVEFFKRFDRDIRAATDNNLDLKVLLALGIIGFTVAEVGATAATPVWVTLTLFTLNHIIEMHASHPAEGRPAAPVIVAS